MVAFGSMFTSCSKDDEEATVTVTLDNTTFNSGAPVTGSITSTNDLQSVTLLSVVGGNESTVSGWPKTSFDALPIQGSDGSYTVRISGLADGSYKLTATDKDGIISSQSFTISAATTLFSTVSTLKATTKIYDTAGDGSNANLYSIELGNARTPSYASSYPAMFDFVYWNNSTNNAATTIYAPNNSAVTAYVSSLTQKNATVFKAGTLNFDTATLQDVQSAVASSTTTSVSNLAIGSVVAFKTAANSSTPSKIGLFKVTSLNTTTGTIADKYLEITVRIQN